MAQISANTCQTVCSFTAVHTAAALPSGLASAIARDGLGSREAEGDLVCKLACCDSRMGNPPHAGHVLEGAAVCAAEVDEASPVEGVEDGRMLMLDEAVVALSGVVAGSVHQDDSAGYVVGPGDAMLEVEEAEACTVLWMDKNRAVLGLVEREMKADSWKVEGNRPWRIAIREIDAGAVRGVDEAAEVVMHERPALVSHCRGAPTNVCGTYLQDR